MASLLARSQLLSLFKWTDHDTVPRGSYYDLHRRIVGALLPNVTTVEALSLAKADWERDSEGNAELPREQAYDAVFQLIDIWTASLDVAECVGVQHPARVGFPALAASCAPMLSDSVAVRQ